MTTVYLSPTEINYAYAVAELRHENAKHNQHQDRFKGEFKNTLPDKIGALGEFAIGVMSHTTRKQTTWAVTKYAQHHARTAAYLLEILTNPPYTYWQHLTKKTRL